MTVAPQTIIDTDLSTQIAVQSPTGSYWHRLPYAGPRASMHEGLQHKRHAAGEHAWNMVHDTKYATCYIIHDLWYPMIRHDNYAIAHGPIGRKPRGPSPGPWPSPPPPHPAPTPHPPDQAGTKRVRPGNLRKNRLSHRQSNRQFNKQFKRQISSQ